MLSQCREAASTRGRTTLGCAPRSAKEREPRMSLSEAELMSVSEMLPPKETPDARLRSRGMPLMPPRSKKGPSRGGTSGSAGRAKSRGSFWAFSAKSWENSEKSELELPSSPMSIPPVAPPIEF